LSEQRRYRKFTAKQKLEIVLASLRGDRSIAELCRQHGIAEGLLRKWREQALEAAADLHRELVRETQATGGVAERVRDPRRRERRHRRLRRPLPAPPAQRAELPDNRRGAPHLGGSAATTKTRGLARQGRRGAGHLTAPTVPFRNALPEPLQSNLLAQQGRDRGMSTAHQQQARTREPPPPVDVMTERAS